MESKKENFLRKLNPVTKLTFVVVCILASLFTPGYLFSFCLFLVIVILSVLGNCFKKFMKAMSSTIFVLVALIFVMQAIFHPGQDVIWRWGFISVKLEGIIYALNLSSKLLVMGGSILLLFQTTTVKEFVIALQQRGLSSVATYVVLSTLQIIPQMNKKLGIIMEAQRSRGMETEGNLIVRAKAFIPSLSPLVLSSIMSTEERALTLEAKAFSAPTPKTHVMEIAESTTDRVLRSVFLLFLFLVLIWRVFL